METLYFDNKICLYIDHQQLIADSYRKYNDGDHYFELKAELFNFKPKEFKTTSNVSNESVTKNNMKRKRSKTLPIDVEYHQNDDQSNLEPFLKHIKINFMDKYTNLHIMPRLWEVDYVFPKFKGCNNTKQFQHVSFGTSNFIIPPLTNFYNYDIKQLAEFITSCSKRYDLIVIDVPWKNKYIRRLKRVKYSLAYSMLNGEDLKSIPVPLLIHSESLVALWCTNCLQHQELLLNDILPTWNLKLVHRLRWMKLNTQGDLISPLKVENCKQPYEILYITCHMNKNQKEIDDIKKINFILSVPSIVHSHKPPLYEWLKPFLYNGENSECLELFARYLHPQCTSIGLEVVKLMDEKLYNKIMQ